MKFLELRRLTQADMQQIAEQILHDPHARTDTRALVVGHFVLLWGGRIAKTSVAEVPTS